jgi:hypothetical protein
MAGNALQSLLSVILPRSQKKGGTSLTGTYTPSAASAVLPVPAFQDHLQDLFDTRQASDARTLIKLLAQQDPDVSAAFNSYLTIAATEPQFFARDIQGQIDPTAMAQVQQILLLLTKQWDYTKGFMYRPSLMTICENLRYMLLATGAVAGELVFDKNLAPSEIRLVDVSKLFWWEKLPGQYKPEQRQAGQILELDLPSFFVSFYHRDPTTIYSTSNFVSCINTIAARQQVINDLYRIMRVTGFPRLDIKVVEEIIVKNAPAQVKQDKEQLRVWVNTRMAEIRTTVAGLRADEALVHYDSIEAKTVNDTKPGAGIDIKPVIDVLNGQNQAALKVMATVIGRGESGVNTASVESRVFSMNCDELNKPVAEFLSNILSLALRLQGFEGYVEVKFPNVELRPALELEPHLTMKSARLKEDLSLGIITDEEYHLAMYGRLPPTGAPTLSGTNFMLQQTSSGAVDAGAGTAPSTGGDSLARSATTPGAKSAKSNTVKKSPVKAMADALVMAAFTRRNDG